MTIDWRSVRVAIAGGGGFLGSHLADALSIRGCTPLIPRTADGWDFRLPDHAYRFFSESGAEIVFNCAARQGGLEYQRLYPADIFHDNLLMGITTLNGARRAGVKKYINVVAACSYPGYLQGMVSEDAYWSGPLHESVVNYGFTKKAQVVHGWCMQRQYGFNSIHLLMTNLYGPREHFHPSRSHGLAALLLKFYDAHRTKAPHVSVWGTGQPIREWLFVRDAADAMIAAAETYDDVAPLNVSCAGGLSIAELAELIKDIVGYRGEIVYDTTKPDGALVKTFDNSRIRALTGWHPRTPLRDGITETLAWLDAHYAVAVQH